MKDTDQSAAEAADEIYPNKSPEWEVTYAIIQSAIRAAVTSDQGADTKRLDWLIKQGCVAFFAPDVDNAEDARKRIDAAMSQRPIK